MSPLQTWDWGVEIAIPVVGPTQCYGVPPGRRILAPNGRNL